MKLNAILAAIRGSKKRDDLKTIINAAEERDSKLSDIEGAKERDRLWEKLRALDIHPGDMVFTHVMPKRTKRVRYSKGHRDGKERFGYKQVEVVGGMHAALHGRPLTVVAVRHRAKVIEVRVPGEKQVHSLSPFTCEKLKLSKEPTASALAAGLARKSLLAARATASLY